MRHIVNFGLLFVFLALVTTGVLAFVLPFSIATTRVHIVAGFLLAILVLLHLGGRIPYFRKHFYRKPSSSVGRLPLTVLFFGVAVLVFLAWRDVPPVSWLVNLSYESRQRAEIVRTSSLAGFGEISDHSFLVGRVSKEDAERGVSLLIRLNEELDDLPAIAVWAETATGTMIETLYLQQALAYSDEPVWHDIKTARNHILPIWRHRYTMVSGINPDGSEDVVSGATESHSYALDPYLLPDQGNKFVICVEINAHGDTNQKWRDTTVGQPSLLYTAYVKVDEEPRYSILELTGHGGGAESSGNVQYDLEGFTSAQHLVDLLLFKLETGE